MEKCDKCGEFIEFARLCPLCAHYEKERLKRSAKKCEERAIEAEALSRELVEALESMIEIVGQHVHKELLVYSEFVAIDLHRELLTKAREVLGDEQKECVFCGLEGSQPYGDEWICNHCISARMHTPRWMV